MREPEPVMVLDLFAEERAALLELLSGLEPDQWNALTACEGWTVRDVALHILGGDLGNLSMRRDRFRGVESAPGEDLVAFINRYNGEWVLAARRLSPRTLVDLLAFVGPQLFAYFATLDLMAPGGSVSWAGLDHAPVWLDVAREYTERWLHQQHIRDATGRPGLVDRRYMGPVLETFAFALPQTFRDVAAPPATTVQLHVEGEAGGDWAVQREAKSWKLYSGTAERQDARVAMDELVAWRLFTKGLEPAEAEGLVSFEGDARLGRRVLQTVSIIA